MTVSGCAAAAAAYHSEDCRSADAAGALQMPVCYRCPSARVVIDRFDLRRSGAHALWLDRDRGIRLLTVAETRGRRPWVAPRGHGAQGRAWRQGDADTSVSNERRSASPRPAIDP